MRTPATQIVINFTNAKLKTWYKNAKIDFNVNGSANTSFDSNTNEYVIDYIENDVKAQFRLNIYDEKVDYLFNAWMQCANIEKDTLC